MQNEVLMSDMEQESSEAIKVLLDRTYERGGEIKMNNT